MKIGIKRNVNEYGHTLKDGQQVFTFVHLLMENVNDLETYRKIYEPVTADKAAHLWFNFKSQNFRKNIGDYMIHEMSNTNVENRLLTTKLQYKDTETSLIEYCEMSDSIIARKLTSMLNFINKDKIIRLNNMGGYTYINSIEDEEYTEIIDEPTVKQITNFIISGNIDIYEYEIKNNSVIIENDHSVPSNLVIDLNKHIDINDITELTGFTNRTTLYKDKDYLALFLNGIENGLENICFETTGQAFHSLRKMHKLLVHLTTLTDVKLNVYIKTWNDEVKELFQNSKEFNTILL